MNKNLNKLVVLDYSGTLSIGTTLFGKANALTNALQQSGLWALGVASEAVFWNQVVNPTWAEGSLTSIGYTSLIVKQVAALASLSDEDQATLQASASQFVDAYFQHGTIAAAWQDIFASLQSAQARVIIATDNYSEATPHIIAHLKALGINSCSALTEMANETTVLVANSADLGFYKANPDFWQKLKTHLQLGAFAKIFVVDDFGFNEVRSDTYSQAEKVKKRSLELSAALSSVLNCEPDLFEFFVEAPQDDTAAYLREYQRMVQKVANFVDFGSV